MFTRKKLNRRKIQIMDDKIEKNLYRKEKKKRPFWTRVGMMTWE